MAESLLETPESNTVDRHTSRYTTNDTYVSRIPSPPTFPRLKPFTSPSLFAGFSPPIGTQLPSFLQNIKIEELVPSKSVFNSWLYSDRYSAQAILPYLYLAPRTVCKDLGFLRKAGITLIVVISSAIQVSPKIPEVLANAKESLGLDLLVLTAPPTQSLSSIFSEAANAINEHIAAQNTAPASPSSAANIKSSVLVCCDSGNELSASVVVAYLMQTIGIDLSRAHRIAQDKRFCIAFNQRIDKTLESYEDILNAQRAIATEQQAPNEIATLAGTECKRSREDEYDDNMEDAEGPLVAGLRDFSPFRD